MSQQAPTQLAPFGQFVPYFPLNPTQPELTRWHTPLQSHGQVAAHKCEYKFEAHVIFTLRHC